MTFSFLTFGNVYLLQVFVYSLGPFLKIGLTGSNPPSKPKYIGRFHSPMTFSQDVDNKEQEGKGGGHHLLFVKTLLAYKTSLHIFSLIIPIYLTEVLPVDQFLKTAHAILIIIKIYLKRNSSCVSKIAIGLDTREYVPHRPRTLKLLLNYSARHNLGFFLLL